VLENPQVQQWLDQQRRHLAELLRTLGPDLDPQSRREAEAFAFEGRTPSNDEAIRREAQASREAAAVATGRSLGSTASALRRIPIAGPGDEEAAEERRRLGREYLARRNREMMELQEKRGISSPAAEEPPASPTSFDAMVDREGKLKASDMELPAVPDAEPESEKPAQEMRQLEQPEPVAPAPSTGGWGWQLGAALANPFGDEFELERSITPRPPVVPPKIKLETKPTPEVAQQVPQEQHDPETRHEELSYEEQMAIAMSLSEAETSMPSATVRQNNPEEPDADLRAAIEASLRDMDGQQAAHAIEHGAPVTPRLMAQSKQPLVDLTPDPPISTPQELPRGDWTSLFGHSVWSDEQKAADPPISVPPQAVDTDEDDLYSATPQLTRARLAVHDSSQGTSQASSSSRPYDPVHEAAFVQQQQQLQAPLEASFYSAHSQSNSQPTSHTMSDAPQLIDVSERRSPLAVVNHTPTVRSRASSVTLDSTSSSSEVFTSLPAISREQTPPRPASSAPRSEMSDVEVIDLSEDSDVDMLSEEGDGVATPDSWTEVGSQDGESEFGQVEATR
jgi:hypothetical protein